MKEKKDRTIEEKENVCLGRLTQLREQKGTSERKRANRCFFSPFLSFLRISIIYVSNSNGMQ